jgi:hypothetical protein
VNREAVQLVRNTVPASGYDWSCMPGRWLTYTLLLALTFPAKVVRPDVAQPVWFVGPTGKRRVSLRGAVPAHDLTGMPAVLTALSDPATSHALPGWPCVAADLGRH